MLGYEWGNPAAMLLSGEEATQDSDQTRQIFEQYDQALAGNFYPPVTETSFLSHHQLFHQQHENQTPLQTLFESRAYSLSYPPDPASLSLDSGTRARGFLTHQQFPSVVPKMEVGSTGDFQARIGLNLGVRTYFSSSEDDFVSRLYRRSRPVEAGPANSPRCQAEGCNADLTHAKHYHRRHKVCEFHSKASTVMAAGLTQRFCQQCSRFHVLSEFDQGKRSCRKRLADHNRRRRKSQPQQNCNSANSPPTGDTRGKSSPESGTQSSSSVTVAISPPPMGLDCFRPMIHQAATSSASSNSYLAQVGSFRPYDRRVHSSSWEEEEGQ